jgi:hypothetical protein
MVEYVSHKILVLVLCHGRIHGRTCECKGSLLKVRKGKYKGEHGRSRWSLPAERVCFCFSGAFKTYDNLGEREKQVIPIQ